MELKELNNALENARCELQTFTKVYNSTIEFINAEILEVFKKYYSSIVSDVILSSNSIKVVLTECGDQDEINIVVYSSTDNDGNHPLKMSWSMTNIEIDNNNLFYHHYLTIAGNLVLDLSNKNNPIYVSIQKSIKHFLKMLNLNSAYQRNVNICEKAIQDYHNLLSLDNLTSNLKVGNVYLLRPKQSITSIWFNDDYAKQKCKLFIIKKIKRVNIECIVSSYYVDTDYAKNIDNDILSMTLKGVIYSYKNRTLNAKIVNIRKDEFFSTHNRKSYIKNIND